MSDVARAGMTGTIVDVWAEGVYEVEVFDGAHQTVSVETVRGEQMTVTLADFFDGERVALLGDIPARGLRRGQVGVIEARTAVGTYRVAFGDADGKTHTRATVHAGQMLLLQWVPVEQSA